MRLRTRMVSVVRMLTTDASVCSTTCVKSGMAISSAEAVRATAGVPTGPNASKAATAAAAMLRRMRLLTRGLNCISHLQLKSVSGARSASRQRHVFGMFGQIAHGIARHLAHYGEPVIADTLAIRIQRALAEHTRLAGGAARFDIGLDEDRKRGQAVGRHQLLHLPPG